MHSALSNRLIKMCIFLDECNKPKFLETNIFHLFCSALPTRLFIFISLSWSLVATCLFLFQWHTSPDFACSSKWKCENRFLLQLSLCDLAPCHVASDQGSHSLMRNRTMRERRKLIKHRWRDALPMHTPLQLSHLPSAQSRQTCSHRLTLYTCSFLCLENDFPHIS